MSFTSIQKQILGCLELGCLVGTVPENGLGTMLRSFVTKSKLNRFKGSMKEANEEGRVGVNEEGQRDKGRALHNHRVSCC